MSQLVKLIFAPALLLYLCASGFAQLTVSPTPLTLGDKLPTVQAAASANFSDLNCEQDGTIDVRHENSSGDSWDIARISPDGSVEHTALAAVPGFGDSHTFIVATADGGAVHEVVRAKDRTDRSDPPGIYYVRFDGDGSYRSRQAFAQEFIPATLLPLPTGDFFAAGVVVKKIPGMEDVEEVPLAGIFDSDARLIGRLKNSEEEHRNFTEPSSSDGDVEARIAQGAHVVLGDDGNIYVLLSSSSTRVRVYSQTGEFRREMTLKQPFEEGLATGLWVSSGRLLVTFEGEADDPKDATTYIMYDAGTGQLMRAYRPQFTGTVACFQGGQSITVLVRQKSSGQLAVGSADLE